jgi:hypothetical protein
MKLKRLLLILLVFSMPAGAWCQLEKGSYLGSASLGFSFQSSRNPSGDFSSKNTAYQVLLNNSFGIFVANRLVLGPGFNINTGYYSSTSESTASGKITSTGTSYSLSFDPFVRYYFFQHGKIALFGEFSGMIGYGKEFQTFKSSMDDQKLSYSNLDYGGGLDIGLVYFINQNIGIETALGYMVRGYQSKQESDINKEISGNLALTAGFTIYLGKCKKKGKEKDTSSSQ